MFVAFFGLLPTPFLEETIVWIMDPVLKRSLSTHRKWVEKVCGWVLMRFRKFFFYGGAAPSSRGLTRAVHQSVWLSDSGGKRDLGGGAEREGAVGVERCLWAVTLTHIHHVKLIHYNSYITAIDFTRPNDIDTSSKLSKWYWKDY